MRKFIPIHQFMSDNKVEIFNSHIIKPGDTDCWLWDADVVGDKGDRNGYGLFCLQSSTGSGRKQQNAVAHRVAWVIANNRDIPATSLVCHKCDNPRCCNPSHLFLGSATENMADMRNKGRGVKVPVWHSDDKILALKKERLLNGTTMKQLSAIFGISLSHVSNILTGKCRSEIEVTPQSVIA